MRTSPKSAPAASAIHVPRSVQFNLPSRPQQLQSADPLEWRLRARDPASEAGAAAALSAAAVIVKQRHHGRRRSNHASAAAEGKDSGPLPEEDEESPEEANKSVPARIGSWWKKHAKIDRKKLSQMGVMCLLSYGFISNINAMTLILLATYRAIVITGASPFASAASLKQFGITYAGLYLFSNVVRPFRMAAAVALQPAFEKFVKRVESTLKCKRAVAITITVIIANVCGTFAFLGLGLFGISSATGVTVKLASFGSLVKAGKSARSAAA